MLTRQALKSWVTSIIFTYEIWVTLSRFVALRNTKPPFYQELVGYFSK